MTNISEIKFPDWFSSLDLQTREKTLEILQNKQSGGFTSSNEATTYDFAFKNGERSALTKSELHLTLEKNCGLNSTQVVELLKCVELQNSKNLTVTNFSKSFCYKIKVVPPFLRFL